MKKIACLTAVGLMTWTMPATAHKPNVYRIEQSPFATYIAQRTGDILTVIVDETAVTEDNGDSELKRNSSFAADLKKFFFPPFDPTQGFKRVIKDGTSPGYELTAKSEFTGNAKNTSRHSFETRIQVRMIEQIRQGEFVIRGYRNVNINGKCKKIYISGAIRQRDIAPDNTIRSHQIADGTVEIEGDVAGDVKPGVISKFINCIF